jgi:hypothetical protein
VVLAVGGTVILFGAMLLFLPGVGWFVITAGLSVLAVAWSPEHVLPLWGTYAGPRDSFIGMDVTVRVTENAE